MNEHSQKTFTACRDDFDAILRRIMDASGCADYTELANFLGTRLSAVSAARRRRIIPDAWLVELAVRLHLNPYWVVTGESCQGDAGLPHRDLGDVPLEALAAELNRRIIQMRDSGKA